MKKIRLIELFSGMGCQNLSMKYLNLPYEQYRTCEWAIKSIQAYKDIHCLNKTLDMDVSTLDKDALVDYLFNKGISNDYKHPMTKEQISRLSIDRLKTIYENIIITNNMVNIQQVHASDLGIVNKDEYDYVMTYSFPCQNISSAGRREGMSRGSNTSSSMLWEVDRILEECKDSNCLPQILVMENVCQIHSKINEKDFKEWIFRLEQFGYTSTYFDLDAQDYGIPQRRKRCFMISCLDGSRLPFMPEKMPLSVDYTDFLEDFVDNSYASNDAMKGYFLSDGTNGYPRRQRFEQNIRTKDRKVINTLTTRSGSRPSDNFIHVVKSDHLFLVNNYRTPFPKDLTVDNLNIRILTELECFRFMGIKRNDFNNCMKNQTRNGLFHLAGDGICVNVLMALFGEIFQVEWEDKVRRLIIDCYEDDSEQGCYELEIKMLNDKIKQLKSIGDEENE